MTIKTTRAKTYEFPVGVCWIEGRRLRASAPGKPDLELATPPEFKHGIPGVWSPEDLLVASAASCYALTLLAVAERRGVPLRGLTTSARGHVGQRSEGPFGFRSIELDAELHTDDGFEDEARLAGETAERGCLIAASLDLPLHVRLQVHATRLLEAPS